jgi:hypothetical protein
VVGGSMHTLVLATATCALCTDRCMAVGSSGHNTCTGGGSSCGLCFRWPVGYGTPGSFPYTFLGHSKLFRSAATLRRALQRVAFTATHAVHPCLGRL